MGAQFASWLVREMCNILNINKTLTTPYHPQSDRLVEEQMIPFRICRQLPLIVRVETGKVVYPHKVCPAYNTSNHLSFGYIPFYLMFGSQHKMPLNIMYGLASNETVEHYQYVANLRKTMELAYVLIS